MSTPKELEDFLVASQMREIQRNESHNEKVRVLELKKRESEYRAAITQELLVKGIVSRELKISVTEVDRMVQQVIMGEN